MPTSARIEKIQEDEEDEEGRRWFLEDGSSRTICIMTRQEIGAYRIKRRREVDHYQVLGKGMNLQPPDPHTTLRLKSRRIRHRRLHPYLPYVRPIRSRRTIPRYFNQSAVYLGPAFVPASTKYMYVRYVADWLRLVNPTNEKSLSFSTVPWPLARRTATPDDMLSDEIHSFVLFGLCGAVELSHHLCREAAVYELHKWRPDRVEECILRRIPDEKERDMARKGAEIVMKSLIIMTTWDKNYYKAMKERGNIKHFVDYD